MKNPRAHATADRMIELISKRLRLLGQPMRIKLIEVLNQQTLTVQELTEAVGGVQQNVSQHLALLHEAGLVSRHKKGTRVWYELADQHALRLLAEARASVARQVGELARLIDDDEGTDDDD